MIAYLPNLSYLSNVGELRYIQSRCEAAEYRNPDASVGAFLSMPQRLGCILRGRLLRSRLRANPFYYYVLARTRYYDALFLEAVDGAVASVINIGCGSDTRAYRFAPLLKRRGVAILECDQPQAIRAKQKIAQQHWSTDHVRYVRLDLNDGAWTEFARRLEEIRDKPALVMMEGVSPYIRRAAFEEFLGFVAARLHSSSLLAYDFKIGAAAQQSYRLPAAREEVLHHHRALGLELQHMELSADLTRRLLPQAPVFFDEDCLLRLSPC